MRPTSGESRSIDYVGKTSLDGFQQRRVIVWIVLEIGVLNDHDVAVRMIQRNFDRGAFSLVVWLQKNSNFVQRVRRSLTLLLQLRQKFPASIFRAVIDQNNFFGSLDRTHPANDLFEGALFVINRD